MVFLIHNIVKSQGNRLRLRATMGNHSRDPIQDFQRYKYFLLNLLPQVPNLISVYILDAEIFRCYYKFL